MRYVHLRSRTRCEPCRDESGGRTGPTMLLTATVQVANDLADQVSNDDGIIVRAKGYVVGGYPALTTEQPARQTDEKCFCSKPVRRPGFSGPGVAGVTTDGSVPWTANRQCVVVKAGVPVSQVGSDGAIQVMIRADIEPQPPAGPARGARPVRGVTGQSAEAVQPDCIGYDSGRAQLVFPPIISVRSAVFRLDQQIVQSGLAERVVRLPGGPVIEIWEDVLAGDYWARVWDSGLALSAYLSLHSSAWADRILQPVRRLLDASKQRRISAIELGCGCGLVGISLFRSIERVDVLVTDLEPARALVDRNIEQAIRGNNASRLQRDRLNRAAQAIDGEDGSSHGPTAANRDDDTPQIAFAALDWTRPIPDDIKSRHHDLVFLSDCTYNTETIPALVSTLTGLATSSSPAPLVCIGRKIRHESEHGFEREMEAAGFVAGPADAITLPGNGSPSPWMADRPGSARDSEDGETVEVLTYYFQP